MHVSGEFCVRGFAREGPAGPQAAAAGPEVPVSVLTLTEQLRLRPHPAPAGRVPRVLQGGAAPFALLSSGIFHATAQPLARGDGVLAARGLRALGPGRPGPGWAPDHQRAAWPRVPVCSEFRSTQTSAVGGASFSTLQDDSPGRCDVVRRPSCLRDLRSALGVPAGAHPGVGPAPGLTCGPAPLLVHVSAPHRPGDRRSHSPCARMSCLGRSPCHTWRTAVRPSLHPLPFTRLWGLPVKCPQTVSAHARGPSQL